MSSRAYNLLRVASLTAAVVSAPIFLPNSTEAARHADETAIVPPPSPCTPPRSSRGQLGRSTMAENPLYDENGRVVALQLFPWKQVYGQSLTTFHYDQKKICFQFRSVLDGVTVLPDRPHCFNADTFNTPMENEPALTVTATFTDELDDKGEPTKITAVSITPERARNIYERALTHCLRNDI